MKQLSLFFADEEIYTLKNVVKRSIVKIKKRYPRPVQGETIEDYKLFIRDEVLLEISERIKDIALHRQNTDIDLLYNEK